MKLRLTARAHRDIADLMRFVAADDPAAAQRVLSRIERSLALLQRMPRLGAPSLRKGTRQLTVPGLRIVIVYRLALNAIEVLTFFHTSQRPEKRDQG